MAHENVLLNNGDDLLLNNNGLVLLNLETAGIHIAGEHPVADLRGLVQRRKKKRTQTVMEAVGQISRVISFSGAGRLFKKNKLNAESQITKTFESRMDGKIWKPNKLWMESTVFTDEKVKLPISDIEREMIEKMKKAKLKKMMKEFREEFD